MAKIFERFAGIGRFFCETNFDKTMDRCIFFGVGSRVVLKFGLQVWNICVEVLESLEVYRKDSTIFGEYETVGNVRSFVDRRILFTELVEE